MGLFRLRSGERVECCGSLTGCEGRWVVGWWVQALADLVAIDCRLICTSTDWDGIGNSVERWQWVVWAKYTRLINGKRRDGNGSCACWT